MSGDAQTSSPPSVMWAQRSETILLTICLEDCKKPEIKINNDSIYFKGIGGTDKKEHEVTINLCKEIDPEKSKYSIRDRIIEFRLEKKEPGPFWPHLTKEKVKYHWLKVDFNKWLDEEDSDTDMQSNMDAMIENMFNRSSDKGAGGRNSCGQEEEDLDSDDDYLPMLDV